MYNPYVLTRPYQHLTSVALMEPHGILCISLDISILIVRFGDRVHTCRVDTPTSHQKRTLCSSIKVSWLFNKFSDNNASDDRLSIAMSVAVNEQISEVILTLGSDAILVAYQINAC